MDLQVRYVFLNLSPEVQTDLDSKAYLGSR